MIFHKKVIFMFNMLYDVMVLLKLESYLKRIIIDYSGIYGD